MSHPMDKDTAWRSLDDELTVVGELGRGAQGIVLEARQSGLGRSVAVKVLHGEPDDAARAKLLLEAERMAVVAHPNVVGVLTHGLLNGTPAVVMEHVDGVSLARVLQQMREDAGAPRTQRFSELIGSDSLRLDETRPWWRIVAALIGALARALESAHLSGVLHRDIKPGNVLISSAGVPYLTDFGAAAGDSEGAPRERAGNVAYSAPEVLLDPGAAGPRSDLYALGIIARELLTGEDAYQGRPAAPARVRAIDRGELRPLARRHPAELRAILKRATAHAPGERYASAGDFARDLEALLSGREIEAQPTGGVLSTLRRGRAWARRYPRAASVAALLAVLAVGVPTTIQLARLRSARVVQAAGERAANHLQVALDEVDRVVLGVVDGALREQPLLDRTRASLLGSGAQLTRDLLATVTPLDDPALRSRLQLMRYKILDGLISVQNRLGDSTRAREHFQEIEGLNLPDDPVQRAKMAYLQMQIDHAARDLDAIEARGPALIAALEAVGDENEFLSLMLASAWGSLLESSLSRGAVQEAVERGRDAVAALRHWSSAADSEPLANRELSRILGNYAAALIDAGDLEEATAIIDETFERLETLAPSPMRDQILATTWNNKALVLHKEGSTEGGLAAERNALAIQDRLMQLFPADRRLRFQASRSRHRAALALRKLDPASVEAQDLLTSAAETLTDDCAAANAERDAMILLSAIDGLRAPHLLSSSLVREAYEAFDRAARLTSRAKNHWPTLETKETFRRSMWLNRTGLALHLQVEDSIFAIDTLIAEFPDDGRVLGDGAIMLAIRGKRARRNDPAAPSAEAQAIESRALELLADALQNPDVNHEFVLSSKAWSALRDDARFVALRRGR